MALLAGFWPERSLHEAGLGDTHCRQGHWTSKEAGTDRLAKSEAKFVGRGTEFGPSRTKVWCFGW